MLGRSSCDHSRKAEGCRGADRSGVRGPIVAMKRGNARGAKGAQEGECGMNRLQESHSAEVLPKRQSEAAKQAEEVCARWAWTDPGVWTDRMLTALETGVKGGQWFGLIDKVYAETTLYSAGRYVTSKPGKASGVDHVTPRHYQRDLRENTRRLSASLRDGSYRPQKIRRTWIPKPGGRENGHIDVTSTWTSKVHRGPSQKRFNSQGASPALQPVCCAKPQTPRKGMGIPHRRQWSESTRITTRG